MAAFTKVIRGRQQQSVGLLSRGDGTLCQTPEESLHHLADTHFPGSLAQRSPPPLPAGSVLLTDPSVAFITPDAVARAAHGFGRYKVLGPDGLAPCVLHNLGPRALSWLTDLYRASYLLGYSPASWRSAKVIFLPKPGKDDYSKARSFRPITLSSFVLKTMERVILWHLQSTTLALFPLHDRQHAFRAGRSTNTALSSLVGKVEAAYSIATTRLASSLTFRAPSTMFALTAFWLRSAAGTPPAAFLRWYSNYIQHRSMSASLAGVSLDRHLTLGTPQGGVLSPVMWNVCFDSSLLSSTTAPCTASDLLMTVPW